MSKYLTALSVGLGLWLLSCGTAPEKSAPERPTSADGLPIAYDVRGSGETGDAGFKQFFTAYLLGRSLVGMRAEDILIASRVAEDGDRDGLPVALIEAAALGVPVVSTDVSGIPELVTRDNGWLVPPDRPDLLAEAVRSCLAESHDARMARTRRARRAVENEFSLASQIETLRQV